MRHILVLSLIATVVGFQNCSMVAPPQAMDASAKSSQLSSEALLETKAFAVINAKCATCHVQNNLVDLRDLDALLYYRLVVPGEPELSGLYNRIEDGSMPPAPAAALRADEIKAIYDWIYAGIGNDGPVTPPAGGGGNATLEPKFASINNLIIKPKCMGCHGSANPMGGLSLANYTGVMNTVQAGNFAASSLYTSVNAGRMPKGAAKLSANEITAIRTWITNGALNN